MKGPSSLSTSSKKALVPSRKLSAGTRPGEERRGVAAPDRTTKAARLYVSPRSRPLNAFEMETRGLSYLLKDHDCPETALQVAAREMAALVWGPCKT